MNTALQPYYVSISDSWKHKQENYYSKYFFFSPDGYITVSCTMEAGRSTNYPPQSDHLKIRNSIILAIFYLFMNNKKTFGTFSVF